MSRWLIASTLRLLHESQRACLLSPMRLIVILAAALLLTGCGGDLGSEPSAIEEQQTQRSFYGPGNPSLTNPPPYTSAPIHEPVPGEVVPDR